MTASGAADRVEPTPDEARNGWTVDTLSVYLADRAPAAAAWSDPDAEQRRRRPAEQNHRYNPLRWRD